MSVSPEDSSRSSQNIQPRINVDPFQDGAALRKLPFFSEEALQVFGNALEAWQNQKLSLIPEEFKALLDELSKLEELDPAVPCWDLLQKFVVENSPNPRALLEGVALLRFLHEHSPTPKFWKRIAPLFKFDSLPVQDRALLTETSLRVLNCALQSKALHPKHYEILQIQQQSRIVLQQFFRDEPLHHKRMCFVEALELRTNFKEQKLIEAFVRKCESELQSRVFSASLRCVTHAGESLEVLQGLKTLLDLLGEKADTMEVELLNSVYQYHLENGFPVSGFIQNFRELLEETTYDAKKRQTLLERFECVFLEFSTVQYPVSSLNIRHLENWNEERPDSYVQEILVHIQELSELIVRARRFSYGMGVIVGLVQLRDSPPNPEALRVIQLLVGAGEAPESIEIDMLHVIIELLKKESFSKERWRELSTLLSSQSENEFSSFGFLNRARMIFEFSEGTSPPDAWSSESYWSLYEALCSRLSSYRVDLSLVDLVVCERYWERVALGSEQEEDILSQFASSLQRAEEIQSFLRCRGESDVVTLAPYRFVQPGEFETVLLAFFGEQSLSSTERLIAVKSYATLARSCHNEVRKTAETILRYERESQRISLHTFQYLAEFAEHFETRSLDNHKGSELSTDFTHLAEILIKRNTPVTFLSASVIEYYSKRSRSGERAETTLTCIIKHLETIASLQPSRTSFESDSRRLVTLEFLHKVGRISIESGAVSALERVLCDDGEEVSLSEVRNILDDSSPTLAPRYQVWKLIGRLADYYRANKFSVYDLLNNCKRLSIELKRCDKATWRELFHLAAVLVSEDLPITLLSNTLLGNYLKHTEGSEERALLEHLTVTLARAENSFGKPRENLKFRKILEDISKNSYGLTDNPAMAHKLRLMVNSFHCKSIEELSTLVVDLKMHALTDIIVHTKDPIRRKWAKSTMSKSFNMGSPPYSEGSPEARQNYQETMEVVRSAFRDNAGFGGFALDGRRPPSSKRMGEVPSMLHRFAEDSSLKTSIVNCSTNKVFPGMGLHIANLVPERLFAPDPRWQELDAATPFWQWLQPGGVFDNRIFHNFNFEDFRGMNFLLLRGLMAVYDLENPRFNLDGINYAYVVYNRHFYPRPEVAALVPTYVLLEALGDCLIDGEDYVGYLRSRRDVATTALDLVSLRKLAESYALNVLDLTYGSVIGGGLCNAYPPLSAPHYLMERARPSISVWKDTWGHLHKAAFIDSDPKRLSELQWAWNLHGDVYATSRALQDQVTALRFGLSFYKMGATIAGEPGSSSESFLDDAKREDISEESSIHPYRYRMLTEIYRWYHGAREKHWNYSATPIFHSGYTLQPNVLPGKKHKKYEIDLVNLSLTTQGGTFRFPPNGDGAGEDERALWREQILPHFVTNSSGWEPRLLLREGAYTLFE